MGIHGDNVAKTLGHGLQQGVPGRRCHSFVLPRRMIGKGRSRDANHRWSQFGGG